MPKESRSADETRFLDVRSAAALVGRHPETVRRWVWSGRLPARREGSRLLVLRTDLEAMMGASPSMGLAAWAELARAAREGAGAAGSGRSAADLVLEDREDRSRAA
jgi:excisionase family DNA binding protein